VLGFVCDTTDRTVGDTARHSTLIKALFHSRSPQALFASTVSFSFVHFASVRIDHGMRAGETRRLERWNIMLWDTLLILYLF